MKLFCWKHGTVALWLAAGSLGATSATAQASVDLGPVFGYYLAFGSEHATDGPNGPGNFSAPIYGGELSAWTRGRLGVQVQSEIAWASPTGIVNPGGFDSQEPGHVVIGTIAAMYDVSVNQTRRLWLSAGPGFVGHRGPAFDRSGSPTEVAAALGVGASRGFNNNSIGVSWGLSTLLYQYTGILGISGGPPHQDGSPLPTGSRAHRFRSDVLVHLSLTFNGHS